jgi:glycosyltransferase involved in cell wall biosynthesis
MTGPARQRTDTCMLDLGVVIPELAKYGGAERLLVECVARWQNEHKITVYASRFNREILREHHVSEEVSLVRISSYFEGAHAPLLNCVLLPKIWEQEIGQHDVYNCHLWPTHLIDRHPMVWYPHEPLRILHDLRYDDVMDFSRGIGKRRLHLYPKQTYDEITYKYLEASLNAMELYDKLGNPERIVANSRFTASYLEEVYGRKVTEVVYPGVSLEDFIQVWPNPLIECEVTPGSIPRSEVSSDENVVVTIAQLWPHKRIDLIIEALKLVDDVQLYVIGDGPEQENLQELAHHIGLTDRVFFLAGLTNLELQIVLARCFAVVFVPKSEPFGIVALEAMAAGKALIAGNEGGYTEVVDETCAFLVPPRIDLIADKIRFLRDNRNVARQMGAVGRTKARAHTWDKTADELQSIVEETATLWAQQQRRVERIAPAEQTEQTLFGIQYYCWYGSGYGSAHWNDNPLYGSVTDTPLSGYYASAKRSTTEQHFRILEEVGLDFLILNLHVDAARVNPYEKAVIDNVFRVASKYGTSLKLAVQLCPAGCSVEDFQKAVDYVSTALVANDHYLHLQGRPALYIFWSGSLDGQPKTINRMKEFSGAFLRIATTLRLYHRRTEHKKTFGLFDGFSLFSPLETATDGDWNKAWQMAYSNSDAGNSNLRIFTISPGYDDSHLEDVARKANVRRKIPRDQGRTYKIMIDYALSLNPRPDQLLISTFNEYHENSHIEASLNHGSLYVDMTRSFIRKAAKQWGRKET